MRKFLLCIFFVFAFVNVNMIKAQIIIDPCPSGDCGGDPPPEGVVYSHYVYDGQPSFTLTTGELSSHNVSQSKGKYLDGSKVYDNNGVLEADNTTEVNCGNVTVTYRTKSRTINPVDLTLDVATEFGYEFYQPSYNGANQNVSGDRYCENFRCYEYYTGDCSRAIPVLTDIRGYNSKNEYSVTKLSFYAVNSNVSKCYSDGTLDLNSTAIWNRLSIPGSYGGMTIYSNNSTANAAINSSGVIDLSGLSGAYTIYAEMPFWKGNAVASFELNVSNPAAPNAGPDVEMHEGQSIDLFSGASTSSGVWTVSSGTVSGSTFTKTDISDVDGYYRDVTATLTIGNGCTSSDTKNIRVYNLPSQALVDGRGFSDVTRCNNSGNYYPTFYADGTFITEYFWREQGSTGIFYPAPTPFSPSSMGIGTHEVIYRISNGAKPASVYVDTYKSFTWVLQSGQDWSQAFPTVCTGSDNIDLYDYVTSKNATTFSAPNKPSAVSGSTFFPNNAGVGTHLIRVVRVDAGGCPITIERNIVVQDSPSIVSFDDIERCKYDSEVALKSDEGYSWSGNGVFQAGGIWYWEPFSSANSNTNTLTAYVQKGSPCEVTTSITAFRKSLPSVSLASDVVYEVYDENGNHNPTVDLREFGMIPVNGGVFTSNDSYWNLVIDNSSYELNIPTNYFGYYSVQFTYTYNDPNGCSKSASRMLHIRGLDVGQLNFGDVERCGSGSVTLTSSFKPASEVSAIGASWQQYYEPVWLNAEGNVIWVGHNLTTPTISATTTYYLALREKNTNRIGNRATVQAIINPIPSFSIGADDVICDKVNGTLDLSLKEPEGKEGGIWSSDMNIRSGNILHAADRSGRNSVAVTYSYTDNKGCVGSDQIIVYFGSSLNVNAGTNGYTIAGYTNGISNETFNLADLNFSPGGGTFSSSDPEIGALINNSTYSLAIGQLDDIMARSIPLTYTVIDSENGCVLTSSISINLVKPGVDNITTVDGAVCDNGMVALNASTNLTNGVVSWFETETGGNSIFTGENYTTSNLSESSDYFVAVYNTAFNKYGRRKLITANVWKSPDFSIGADDVICDKLNGTLDLSVKEPEGKEGGIWSSNMNIRSGNILHAADRNGRNSVAVTYSYTDGNGCIGSDEMIVYFGSSLNVNAGTNGYTVSGYTNGISNETFNLSDLNFSPGGGEFASSDLEIDSLINNATYSLAIGELDDIMVRSIPLTYTVIDSENGCVLTDTISINLVKPGVDNITTIDGGVCDNGIVALNASTNLSNGVISWFLTETGGNSIFTGENYTTSNLTETKEYYVSIYNTAFNKYGRRKLITANVWSSPEFSIGSNVVICDRDNGLYDLQNDVEEGFENGVWSSSQMDISSGIVDASLRNGFDNITAKYTYTDANGCISEQSKQIQFGSFLTVNAGNDNSIIKGYINGEKQNVFNLSNLEFSPSGGRFYDVDDIIDANINNTNYTLDISSFSNEYADTIKLRYEVLDGNSGCLINDTVSVIYSSPDFNNLEVLGSGVCDNGVVGLEVINSGVGEVAWFREETGSNVPVAFGSTFDTPSISLSRDYYVSVYNANLDTYSKRVKITANVWNGPDFSIGSDVWICDVQNGSYDLTNDEPTNFTGGVWTIEGDTIPDGLIVSDSSVDYVDVVYSYTNSNNCSGSESKRVNFGSTLDMNAGNNRTVSLVTNGTVETVFDLTDVGFSPAVGRWTTNDAILSGKINNTNFTVDVSSVPFTDANGYTATLYYNVLDNLSGCELIDSVQVTFVKIDAVANNFVVNDGITCGIGRVTLTANTDLNGYVVRWYSDQANGTLLATGESFQTPSISSSRSYYAEVYNSSNGVSSIRKLVNAEVGLAANVEVPQSEVVICNVENNVNLYRHVSPQNGFFISDYVNDAGDLLVDSLAGVNAIDIEYSFTNSTGCTSTKEFSVRIGSSNTLVDAGSGYAACFGTNQISLSASPSGGTWTFVADSLNQYINGNTVNSSSFASGNYTMRYLYQTTNGCLIEDEAVITIMDNPEMPIISDQSICGEGSLILEIENEIDHVFNWYLNPNDAQPFHVGRNFQTETLTSDVTYYIESVNSNNCKSAKKSLRISVNEIPTVDVGAPVLFCNESVEFDLSVYENISGGIWSGPGVEDGIFKGSLLEQGVYELIYEFTSQDRCSKSDVKIVTLGLDPNLIVSNELVEIGQNVSFELDLDSQIESIKWYFGDGFTSNQIKPSHVYYNSGVFDVRVEVQLINDCSGNFEFNEVVNVSGEEFSIITSNIEEFADLSLYPNPVRDHISFNGKLRSETDIILMDASGKIIGEETVKENSINAVLFEDKIKNMPAGMYMMMFKSATSNKIFKIIKQ